MYLSSSGDPVSLSIGSFIFANASVNCFMLFKYMSTISCCTTFSSGSVLIKSTKV
ncbi:hypothetical protein HanHA300_Chr03g0094271 [Helianthus annuus]|nr:hypothetical protein HanHA300_Chr03g0094271 [Helianthus annuus]KAJ0601007.1 hypothetical protein HanIR_Chr03g0123521 [Helianthus annuus]KAJ0608205.1 hypothetical protein HanHA89_Chr03g0105991 [Helianthus annuus]KAJ0768268.1 hypothetical protein HanLR1_Chr03g0099341 [Helianthus annuus]KAJ0774033.1 hypothetical protein HanOQP8_Chr03g0107031 [Helianthus annuus]